MVLEIHDKQEQTYIFATTWEDIITPRDTIEVQQNIQNVNNLNVQNQQKTLPKVKLNRLRKDHPLTKPIRLI